MVLLFGSVRVRVTLRLTVSQSVYLGVGHPFGAHDQILLFPFLLPENCFTLCLAAPSLTRGWICNLQCNPSVVTVAEDP
jgi:hypothetical protein